MDLIKMLKNSMKAFDVINRQKRTKTEGAVASFGQISIYARLQQSAPSQLLWIKTNAKS